MDFSVLLGLYVALALAAPLAAFPMIAVVPSALVTGKAYLLGRSDLADGDIDRRELAVAGAEVTLASVATHVF